MAPELRYVDVRGVRLAFREEGEGAPVLCVHGSLAGLDTFRRQLPVFARRYRVIAYGRRYHPPSGPAGARGPYALDEHAEDLYAFLRTLDLERPHIVASSYGGYVAVASCLAHPEMASSLVLGEPPMLRLLERSEEGRRELEHFRESALIPARSAFLRGAMEEGVRRFFDGIRGEPGAFDTLSTRARHDLLVFAPELALELTAASALFMPDIGESLLAGLRLPVLLLMGSRSPAFFHRITRVLEVAIPGARCEEIPGADHSIHTSAPEPYNTAVLTFLTCNSGRKNLP